MSSTYNTTRLDTLSSEIELINGAFETWQHLSLESADAVTSSATPPDSESTNEHESVDAEMDMEDEEQEDGEDADAEVDVLEEVEVDDDEYEEDHDEMDDEEEEEDRFYSGFGQSRARPMDQYEMKHKLLQRILKDLSLLVRQSQGCSDFDTLLPKAQGLIDKAAGMQCTSLTALSESFSHSNEHPMLLSEPFEQGSGGMTDNHYALLSLMAEIRGLPLPPIESLGGGTQKSTPWPETFRPHPLTTKFSRFKDCTEVTPTPTHDQPIANTVYTARCEVIEQGINYPTTMIMSPNAEIILRDFVGGYKNRITYVKYHLMEDAGNDGFGGDFPMSRGFRTGDPGHADHARYHCFEESRKLFFTAEWTRIKSFRWKSLEGGAPYQHALPTHTFKSGEWSGPLTTLSSGEGKLVRAGKGSAGVWNLDSAPTHGEDGKETIGDDYNTEETWRDDPERIEGSAGSPVDSTITYQDSDFNPSIWHTHPSQAGVMLAGTDPERSKSFAFVSLDLANGGKITERYLGHGGAVQQISTVEGQPQTFTTACMDGFVRLWDTRTPLPVLTIQIGRDEGCTSVAYANPDGIPTIFTGAGSEEHIRLWDVRARSPIYELATGNNSVLSLAWDHRRNHLWAATIAESRGSGYRRGNVPAWDQTQWDAYRRWPKRAHNAENHFGVMYDSGESKLYRYAFKEDPDPTALPVTLV